MTISGIYKLDFGDDYFYIGKSKDIERRWKEHHIKFQKGTATRNMQEAFNRYGYPKKEVILEVHPEHLDVLEPILIHNNWNEYILNTTHESCATDMEDAHLPLVKESLGNLCRRILQQNSRIEDLEVKLDTELENFNEILEDIKDGTALATAERELKIMEESRDRYKEISETRSKKILRLRSRGLFARIFNK